MTNVAALETVGLGRRYEPNGDSATARSASRGIDHRSRRSQRCRQVDAAPFGGGPLPPHRRHRVGLRRAGRPNSTTHLSRMGYFDQLRPLYSGSTGERDPSLWQEVLTASGTTTPRSNCSTSSTYRSPSGSADFLSASRRWWPSHCVWGSVRISSFSTSRSPTSTRWPGGDCSRPSWPPSPNTAPRFSCPRTSSASSNPSATTSSSCPLPPSVSLVRSRAVSRAPRAGRPHEERPSAEISHLPRNAERQSTLLVRGHPDELGPAWQILEPDLDEIVLAYLSEPQQTTSWLTSRPRHTWVKGLPRDLAHLASVPSAS